MQVSLSIGEVLGPGDLAYGAGLRDVAIYQLAGRTFIYLLGGTGGGLTAIEMLANGDLSFVAEMSLQGSYQTGVEPRLLIAELDGAPTLVISGQAGALARSVDLNSDGSFGSLGSLSGDPAALIQPTMVNGPDGTYLIGGSPTGLTSYLVSSGPTLTASGALTDTADTYLADVTDTATVNVGGAEYVLATSGSDAALTVLSVGNSGAFTVVGDIGAADRLGISQPTAVEAIETNSRSFALVAGTGTSSLSVVEVLADGGTPIVRDHVVDNLGTRFQSVEAIASTSVLGRTFAAAGGADDGVSLFTLSPTGRLIHLATFEDTVAATLTNISGLAISHAGNNLQIVAAGLGEDGVTRLQADITNLGLTLAADDLGDSLTGGAADDMIAGGVSADTLIGGAGNDILIDGGGSDTLTGGAGADLFVFDADGQTDTITDFEPGTDSLDLSAFAFLNDPTQLTAQSQTWGVRLLWGGETIDIYRQGGGTIDISGWTSADILNLDRPQYLPIAQILQGDSGDNSLRGGEGDDTISGSGGVDTLDGEGGADTINAGTGNDFVTGGTGNDELRGEAGFDDIRGGSGDDEIWGGNEADVLYGDAGNDILRGEVGVDNLFGGIGNDIGYGGSENDWLWGGEGQDTLYGDTQEDRIFGEAGDDVLYGGAGFDRLEGGPGQDTIYGGNQADNLFGQDQDDTLWGEGGFDRLFGGNGDDWANGGTGPDSLFGDAGNDTLDGGVDNDRFFGGSGNDLILGDDGDDTVWAGSGFDTIIGGPGNDTLEGNFNADVFIFADGHGVDQINDFDALNAFEKIDFSGLSSIVDYADLSANHMSQVGGDVVISSGANSVTLFGILLENLDASDFIF